MAESGAGAERGGSSIRLQGKEETELRAGTSEATSHCCCLGHLCIHGSWQMSRLHSSSQGPGVMVPTPSRATSALSSVGGGEGTEVRRQSPLPLLLVLA